MQRKGVLDLGRETSLRTGVTHSPTPGPGVATEILPEAGTVDRGPAWEGHILPDGM